MNHSSNEDIVLYDRPGREEIDAMIRYFENERKIMETWAKEDFLMTSKHRHARVERAKARKRRK